MKDDNVIKLVSNTNRPNKKEDKEKEFVCSIPEMLRDLADRVEGGDLNLVSDLMVISFTGDGDSEIFGLGESIETVGQTYFALSRVLQNIRDGY